MGDKSEGEKEKAYQELSQLIRDRTQKKRNNKKTIEERIEKIKRDFPGGRI